MAQYFDDFSGSNVDSFPQGWTPRLDSQTSDWTVNPEQGATGGKYLQYNVAGTSRRAISLDAADADEGRFDAEILFRVRAESLATDDEMYAMFRGSGTVADANLYRFGIRGSTVRLDAYKDGSFQGLASESGGQQSGDTNVWFFAKAQCIGTTHKVKSWLGTVGDEPSDWQAETTDTDITDVGWLGLFSFRDGTIDIDYVGIGTNGDPAPTEEPTGDTDDLTANDIESVSQVSDPAITQTHNLNGAGTESATQVSAPTAGQTHALAANDAESSSETSQPAIAQTHEFSATGIESLSEVSQPSLQAVAGSDALAANDVEASSETSSPSLAQAHALNPQMVEAGSTTSTASIGQAHSLSAQSVSSESSVTSPTLRDASQVLKTPIRNTSAAVTQTRYNAVAVTTDYKTGIIETNYSIEVA